MNTILTQQGTILTQHGSLQTPAFLPDGTRAVVRAVDSQDLAQLEIEALVVNTLHLSEKPGATLVQDLGGVHGFMNWSKPLLSDSGGFQVYSLLRSKPPLASISKQGFHYRLDKSHEKSLLTPEKCIVKQHQLKTDIWYCLDVCTHPQDDAETQLRSVEWTLDWAKRCKKEYQKLYDFSQPTSERPLLMAVVQGGDNLDLRKRCTEELLEIGFDGFGFGGWPIEDSGELTDAVCWVAEMLPKDCPKHALGIGKAENILKVFAEGYNIFDCTLPTRDARQRRLYVLNEPLAKLDVNQFAKFYHYIYLQDKSLVGDKNPIDVDCDCSTCQHYSRAYLHHLFHIEDHLAYRLATIHNLRFYARLMQHLRKSQ